jgi:hypothetical protein
MPRLINNPAAAAALLLLLIFLPGLASAFVSHTPPQRQRGLVSCKAGPSPADKLRQLLKSPPDGGILIMPCCYDGLTARMVEMHGFPITFMTGFGVSAARGACVHCWSFPSLWCLSDSCVRPCMQAINQPIINPLIDRSINRPIDRPIPSPHMT